MCRILAVESYFWANERKAVSTGSDAAPARIPVAKKVACRCAEGSGILSVKDPCEVVFITAADVVLQSSSDHEHMEARRLKMVLFSSAANDIIMRPQIKQHHRQGTCKQQDLEDSLCVKDKPLCTCYTQVGVVCTVCRIPDREREVGLLAGVCGHASRPTS